MSFPAAALGCDDEDCPALDGASLGLRGNKLAFNVGCIANSTIKKNASVNLTAETFSDFTLLGKVEELRELTAVR